MKEKQGFGQTMFLLVLIGTGLVLCYLQFGSYARAQTRLGEEQSLLAAEEEWLKVLKALHGRADELEKEWEALRLKLPDTAKEEQFLMDVNTAAALAGMELVQVRFAERLENEGYTEMPLQVTLSGTYHQLLDFFACLQAYERAVRIHEVEAEKESGLNKLTVKISASIFFAPPQQRRQGLKNVPSMMNFLHPERDPFVGES